MIVYRLNGALHFHLYSQPGDCFTNYAGIENYSCWKHACFWLDIRLLWIWNITSIDLPLGVTLYTFN